MLGAGARGQAPNDGTIQPFPLAEVPGEERRESDREVGERVRRRDPGGCEADAREETVLPRVEGRAVAGKEGGDFGRPRGSCSHEARETAREDDVGEVGAMAARRAEVAEASRGAAVAMSSDRREEAVRLGEDREEEGRRGKRERVVAVTES